MGGADPAGGEEVLGFWPVREERFEDLKVTVQSVQSPATTAGVSDSE